MEAKVLISKNKKYYGKIVRGRLMALKDISLFSMEDTIEDIKLRLNKIDHEYLKSFELKEVKIVLK